MVKYLKIIIVIFALMPASLTLHAQSKNKPRPISQAELDKKSKESREAVIKASNEYKASLAILLAFEEANVKAAAETVEKRKELLEQKIISKLDLEKSERALAAARAKVNETQKKMRETDNLIAEVRAEAQLARMPRGRVGAYQATAALIRYNGASRWALADASKVERFFFSSFRRALPISAFGQTETHNRLGFNHSNSIDVAVHPDSQEGRTLMAYLRGAGIPFIAFRQAVQGSATGAHIHIGYPSHRIAR